MCSNHAVGLSGGNLFLKKLPLNLYSWHWAITLKTIKAWFQSIILNDGCCYAGCLTERFLFWSTVEVGFSIAYFISKISMGYICFLIFIKENEWGSALSNCLCFLLRSRCVICEQYCLMTRRLFGKSGRLHDALFLQMMRCLLWKIVCHCLFAFVKQW